MRVFKTSDNNVYRCEEENAETYIETLKKMCSDNKVKLTEITNLHHPVEIEIKKSKKDQD